MNDRDPNAARPPAPSDAGSTPPDLEGAVSTGGTGGPGLGRPDNVERNSGDTDALTAGARASGAPSASGQLPNTTTNPRQGAAPAWFAEDVRLRDFELLQPGWSVISADGEQMGPVLEKRGRWFSLRYGTGDERTMYIPLEYIETATNNRVILNQPAGLLIDMKLSEPPEEFEGVPHREVSGTDHDPRRAEIGGKIVIPEPVDQPAQSPLPPGPGVTSVAAGAAERQLTGRPDVQSAAGGASPVATPGHTPAMRIEGAEGLAEARGSVSSRGRDSALQPAMPQVRQTGPQQPPVEPELEGRAVSRAETDPRARTGAVTHMDAPIAPEPPAGLERVNPEGTEGGSFDENSGYRVLERSEHFDRPDGPTHQPGVKDPESLEPLRTQFGKTGTPGEGLERNVTDLDLVKNQHPGGSPFDSQAATVGRPLTPHEPSAAERSREGTAGLPTP
jgi:hypothetical protein